MGHSIHNCLFDYFDCTLERFVFVVFVDDFGSRLLDDYHHRMDCNLQECSIEALCLQLVGQLDP